MEIICCVVDGTPLPIRFSCFVTMPVVMARICQHLAQPRSWRTTPCRLSATTLCNIFAATLHTEGRSSIRKPRTRHAVLTGTQLSWHSFPSSVDIFSRTPFGGGGGQKFFRWGPNPLLTALPVVQYRKKENIYVAGYETCSKRYWPTALWWPPVSGRETEARERMFLIHLWRMER